MELSKSLQELKSPLIADPINFDNELSDHDSNIYEVILTLTIIFILYIVEIDSVIRPQLYK